MKSAKRQQIIANEESRKEAMAKADGGNKATEEKQKTIPLWEQSLNEEYKKPPTKKELEADPSLKYQSGFGANYPLRLSEYHDKWLELFEKRERRSRQKMLDHIIDYYIKSNINEVAKLKDVDDEIISG